MSGASPDGQTVRLKSSPLGILIAFLGLKFPEIAAKDIDRAVIESKCALPAAEIILEELIRSTQKSRLDRLYSAQDRKAELGPGSSGKPERVFKVYRLDGSQSNEKIV